MRTITALRVHGTAAVARTQSTKLTRDALLVTAAASSLLYITTTIIGALQWPDYHWQAQTISELSAIDAPSRATVVLLMTAYSMLILALGVAMRTSAPHAASRTVGLLLSWYGVACLIAPLTPMHLRAAPQTLTDGLHITLTIVTAALILTAVGVGAFAFGRRFRAYSFATLLVFLTFGTLTGLQGPAIAADLPTPLAGLFERISVFSFMAWIVAFAALNARSRPAPRVAHHEEADDQC